MIYIPKTVYHTETVTVPIYYFSLPFIQVPHHYEPGIAQSFIFVVQLFFVFFL